ncbi:hypothetical protein L226DRAFT_558800 [Lentinus tigrinus ALCF2SS1-7]|uniref:Uncharacterized protein n=1 Tax=Lentinus tigrinus ALCF2SS1-6 TaxID=1328759 RepID=A0A5C2SFF8_9APHY|nr:hypothetical protein L227DRAFT_573113 [Lentinus tigrinus ALCF2SS1-6]RPD77676.1 hypothetical protein L226DRAFT_558800 [Lentinus tigrinus ALCF2SS1-7]
MSYDRTTESWNNDPNNFSNPSGPDNFGAFSQQGGGQRGDIDDQQWSQDQGSRPTRDPMDPSISGTDPSSRRQRQSDFERDDLDSSGNNWDSQGARGHWAGSTEYGSTGTAGNTTDMNTIGAGGNQYGRGADEDEFDTGPQGGIREGDNWHRSQDTAGSGGKPSTGHKTKGTVEKLKDRITGRD